MNRDHCTCLRLVAALALAGSLVSAADPPDETARQARQLAAKYRTVRGGAERRAAVVKELVALGPAGVAAADDLIRKELEHLATYAGPAPKTAKLDAVIDQLRKVLADLRDAPNLSHDQLEQVGLPALDRLTQVYRQRSAQTAAWDAKVARTAAQLDQSAALADALQQEWPKDPPLPLPDYTEKIKKLRADFSRPEAEVARKVFEQNAALSPKLDPNVLAGMQAVNAMRMMCGLRPLVYDLKLCEAARGHSADMQANNFFAHESPVPGKKTPWDRAKLAGTTASGENIFMGSAVSMEALRAWFLSPGHHKNLFRPNNRRQGLGYAGKYWTQEFGS
ncbi:MAG: CAP domain-containing protein [Thermoguttaceae bacterium]|jgi:uncharacterized protein YkwD